MWVKRAGFTGSPFLHVLDLLRCWSVSVEHPCVMASHRHHKEVFVAYERGHLASPVANKRSHSPPFLWFCLAHRPQTKAQRLDLFTGKWIKGQFALILLLHKRSHFFVQKSQRAEHFFHQQNQTIRSIASFRVAIKEGNLIIVALLVCWFEQFSTWSVSAE